MSSSFVGMTQNNAVPQSYARAPRGFVSLNGIQVPWQRFVVSNTRYSAAGTFRIDIPATALPKNSQLATLINEAPLVVQINAGIPAQTVPSSATPSDLPMIIQGNADHISFEPHNTMLTIVGRDYSSYFLDHKVSQANGTSAFTGLNPGQMTSSQIVTTLATLRGLKPVVTQTMNAVGVYLQNKYSLNSTQITEWDLMTYLARQENFDIFVIGKSLYFQPKQLTSPYQITLTIPYYTTPTQIPGSNAVEVTFSRNMRLAKDIIVNVSSWNQYNNTTYSGTATLIHSKSKSSGNAETYNYVFPNLTQDQVQQKANNLLLQISEHEMTVNIKMPADEIVTAHTPISINSTNTLFDQTYYVKNVTREMEFNNQDGYSMTIEAKSQSPYTITVNA